VTFSGDTTKSDNLIRLAQGTDILVHESQFSLDDAYHHNIYPPNYLPASHTSAEQVGEVGAAANTKHVVLSHYGPWASLTPNGKTQSEKTTKARSPSPATVRSSPSDPVGEPHLLEL
jgi:ribonuclease BN (tRNA processing enzyme)